MLLQRLNIESRTRWNHRTLQPLIASPTNHAISHPRVPIFIRIKIGKSPKDALGQVGIIPIESAKPEMNVGVIMSDAFEVGVENGVVRCVESDEGGEEADVGFCDVGAEEEGLMIG